jgi:hypothetical protein
MSDENEGRLRRLKNRLWDAVRGASRSERWRFVVSFTSSLLVLLLVVFLVTSGFAQIIATIASIGGIQAEIGELRGSNINIYPAVGESSNCPWQTPGTFSGPQEDPPGSGTPRYQNPVGAGDQALPMLRADISNAQVPAGYGVSFTKDIELPGPFGADAFRVEISRNETLVPGTAALFESPVNQDFEEGGFVPTDWITSGSASITSSTQNSGRYSAQISMGSTTNELVSPTVDTTVSSGDVRVEFWVQRGSNDISDLPESGEDLIVEYLDSNGNWDAIPSSPIQADNFRPEGERTVRDELTGADVTHSGFQVRFRGDGDGSDDIDYWHVDDVKVERARYSTPRATSVSDQFLKSVSLTSTNSTVQNKIVPIEESTAFDRGPGRRDLTQARMYLVKGTEYNLKAVMDTVATEASAGLGNDYNQQISASKAWIDWDNDTDLGGTELPDDEYNLGSGDGGGNGVATVDNTFTVPNGADTGPTLLRVMMEANQGDPNNLDPDTNVNRGFVEDYSVVVVDSVNDIPSPVSIGDASLKTTGLEADFVDLRGGFAGSKFILEDKYSTASSGGTSNPVFAADPPPQGEFSLRAEGSGRNAKIRDASAILHQLAFSSLDISLLELDIKYISDEEAEIATGQCPILEPQFLPRITNAPLNVSPNDNFVVDYEIRNPGLESETQDVNVSFPNGNVQNSFTETIPATTTETFSDTLTAPGTAGRYDVVVNPNKEPASKSATQEIIVGDVPNFQVTVDDVSPNPVVAEDETLEVQTTVTNTGDVVGTQDIRLFVGGSRKDIDTRTINGGGASQTFNFSYVPSDVDAGASVPVEVRSDDDSDTQNVQIKESPEYVVNITGSNAPVDAGNDLVVDVNVTNTGGAVDTQDIHLDIENSQGVKQDVDNNTGVTLNPGQSTQFQLSYTTSNIGDPPEVDATVRSDDGTDTKTLTVEGQGPVYQVNGVTPIGAASNGVVDPGETIEVEAEIQNVGSADCTAGSCDQEVYLDILPDAAGSKLKVDSNTSLFLNAPDATNPNGEKANVTLSYVSENEDAPSVDTQVRTFNTTSNANISTDNATVDVNQPAFFDPTITDANASVPATDVDTPIEERDDVQVQVDVQNTGQVEGSGTVVLEVDANDDGAYERVGDVQAIENLAPSGTRTVVLDYATQVGDADSVDVRVRGYTTRREAENFDEGGSQPAGWTFDNDASINSDSRAANSGTYSAKISAGSTGNRIVSPGVNTSRYSDSGVFALDYWALRGSDSIDNVPESGEDLVVEYKDSGGVWNQVETIQASNLNPAESTSTINELISDPAAFHDDFQVRFRGNGGGTDGADYWYVDDVAIKSGDVDGSDTGTSLVLTPPNYQVTIQGTNEPRQVGTGGVESLSVTAQIENTGTASGDDQTIELNVDGGVQDSTTVNLAGAGNPGDTTNVGLLWDSSSPSPPSTCNSLGNGCPQEGSYNPTVSSANTSDSTTADYNRPEFEAVFTGSQDTDGTGGTTNTVDADGGTVNAEIEATNPGRVQDTQRFEFELYPNNNNRQEPDTVDITASANGGTGTGGVSWTSSCSDHNDGQYDMEVTIDRLSPDGINFGNNINEDFDSTAPNYVNIDATSGTTNPC